MKKLISLSLALLLGLGVFAQNTLDRPMEPVPAMPTQIPTVKQAKALMASPETHLKCQGAWALLQRKPSAAQKTVLEALQSGNRPYAAAVLGYADEVASPQKLASAIAKAYPSLDEGAKACVLYWIGRNGLHELQPVIDESIVPGEVGEAAIFAATQLGGAHNEALLENLPEWARPSDTGDGLLATHVIIIGLDGWGSWCMEKGECPFIREKMQEGSWTLKKRTVLPSSSGPNWAAMMNGTPVESSGWYGNDAEPRFKPLVQTEHGNQPTFFHLLAKQRPEMEKGVICEWGDFLNYADTLCLDYFKRIDDPSGHPDRVVEESVRYILDGRPNLLFVHIDALDHMGHAFGQGSQEYYDELPRVDDRVRRIVEALKTAGIYDDSIIMITSDHGHMGTGHGGISQLEIETPFVIWGKGIKKGYEIPETMIQYDMAAIVARIFNLEVPQSWRGKVIDVFEK